jgi:hypothetical protein
MTDHQEKNDVYASVIVSIGELFSVTESIKKGKAVLTSFSDYMTQNEEEISKFESVTNEVCGFMNSYDFSKGFHLESMLKKLQPIHSLRLKLRQMGGEAKKLTAYPDRYGSKRAIEICRSLSMKCKERLTLDEIEKVSQIVDTNINKLIEILKEFQGDGYILLQINEAIEANKGLLTKYKAFFAELQQYVAGFPHPERNDLAIVTERIETAKKLDTLLGNAQKSVAGIQNYYDRYGKNALVARYKSTTNDIFTRMHYVDVNGYKSKLCGIIKEVKEVSLKFEKEHQEIVNILSVLSQNKPEIWKEDNEELKKKLTQMIDRDTRMVQLDVDKIKNNITAAKRKRVNDIKVTTEKYSWLRWKKYTGFHDRLVSRYISYSEYQSAIADVRKERIINILKTIGKVLLFTVGIPFVIIYFILKVIFGSNDD